MTTLEAVNRMLLRCSFGKVGALDTNGSSTAAYAEYHLDMASIDVQAEGWHFNTRTDVEAEPDGSDNITLPTGTIEMDSDGEDAYRDVAQVGGKLYDKDDNTEEFDGSIQTAQTLNYNFGCVPFRIKGYVVIVATLSFAMAFKPMERGLHRQLQHEIARYKTQAKRADSEARDVNTLRTPEAMRLAGRRYGWYGERWVP